MVLIKAYIGSVILGGGRVAATAADGSPHPAPAWRGYKSIYNKGLNYINHFVRLVSRCGFPRIWEEWKGRENLKKADFGFAMARKRCIIHRKS